MKAFWSDHFDKIKGRTLETEAFDMMIKGGDKLICQSLRDVHKLQWASSPPTVDIQGALADCLYW